jgi:hypothetical protein
MYRGIKFTSYPGSKVGHQHRQNTLFMDYISHDRTNSDPNSTGKC